MKESHFFFLAKDFDELYRSFQNVEKYAQANEPSKFVNASKNIIKLILRLTQINQSKLEDYKEEFCDCWNIINDIENLSDDFPENTISTTFYENILNKLKHFSIWFVVYNQGKLYSRSVYSDSEYELVQKYYVIRKEKFNLLNEVKDSLEAINTKTKLEKKQETVENDKLLAQVDFLAKIKENSFIIIGILSVIIVICLGIILFGGQNDTSVHVTKTGNSNSEIEKSRSSGEVREVVKSRAYSPKGYLKDLPNPMWMADEVGALNRKVARNNGDTKAFNPYDFYYKYAADGYANAQFYLAYCYLTGFQMDKNIDQAKFWYEKAAEQGLFEAQNALKKIKGSGGNIQPPLFVQEMPDVVKAQFLKRYDNLTNQQMLDLANAGDAYAQYRIGQANRMYGIKYIVDREKCKNYMREAERWLIKSANQNCVDAMLTLSVLYEEGYGIGKNLQQSKYYKNKYKGSAKESMPYRITSININREKYTQ